MKSSLGWSSMAEPIDNGTAESRDASFKAAVAAAVDERVVAALEERLPKLFRAMAEQSAKYVERTMSPRIVEQVVGVLDRKGQEFRDRVRAEADGGANGDDGPGDFHGDGGEGGPPDSGSQHPLPGGSEPQPSPQRNGPGVARSLVSAAQQDPFKALEYFFRAWDKFDEHRNPMLKLFASTPTPASLLQMKMLAPVILAQMQTVAPEQFNLYTPSPWDNQFTGLLAAAYKQGARTKADLRRWLDTPEGGASRPEPITRTEPQPRYWARPAAPSSGAPGQPSDVPRPQSPSAEQRNAVTRRDSAPQAQRRARRPLEGLV